MDNSLMVIMSARGAGLALLLAARPAEAWLIDAPWILGPMPSLAATVAWQALPGSIVMAGVHVWLCTDSGVRAFERLRVRLGAAFASRRGEPTGACCT